MAELSEKALKRIRRSALNTSTTLITSIIMGIMNFVERTVFNRFFIEDFLGLYSFNYNIINMLGFIELGITSSIAFALYAPVEYDNQDQIIAIMRFFRKAYLLIGIIIVLGGVLLLPLFPFLLNTSIPINEARLYFMIFLISSALTYFVSYRNILLAAHQENYKTTFWTNTSYTLMYFAEIVVAITTQNFLFYSLCILFGNLFKVLIMRHITTKEFPFLKSNKKITLDPSIKTHIYKNTRGLINTKLGQVLINSTDSVLISVMVGTAFLGKYANYQMITSGLLVVSTLLPTSITSSVGNAGVTESKKTLARSFATLDFSSFLIYSSITLVLLNIANPIVSTFFGIDRILPFSSVLLICLNFYLSSMREILLTFKSSLGLYWQDRKRPIIGGITNLITSIVFGQFLGFNGIILGTIFTHLFVNLAIEPLIIFHEGLFHSALWYYVTSIGRFVLVTIISLITVSITNLLPGRGLQWILIRALISIIIILPIYFVVFRKNENAVLMIKTLKVAFMSKYKK